MVTNINSIFNILQEYNPKLYLHTECLSLIHDVHILKKGEYPLKSSLLYITDILDMTFLSEIDDIFNILYICRSSFESKAFSDTTHNVIVVYGDYNTQILYNKIDSFIVKQSQILECSVKIYDSILSDKGLQHVTDIASNMFKNPLFVSDLSYKILSYSKNIAVEDPMWANITSGYGGYEKMVLLKKSGIFDKTYKNDFPITSRFDFFEHRMMGIRIIVNGKVAGHIAILEYNRPFKDSDEELLKIFSKAVSNELQKKYSHIYMNGKVYEYFIYDLLEGKSFNEKNIEERLQYLHLDISGTLQVLTVRCKQNDSSSISLNYIRDILENILDRSKACIYNDDIVVIISSKNADYFNDSRFNELKDFLKQNNIIAGLSTSFNKIVYLKEHYIQSCTAIDLGVHLKKEDYLFLYYDYTVYDFINTTAQQKDIRSCCNPLLFKLLAYDKEYNVNYTDSLYIYLFNGCNLIEAAQFFNIHRNSMDYRINKIQELLNVKINNPDTVFSLYFSFKILIYLGDYELKVNF